MSGCFPYVNRQRGALARVKRLISLTLIDTKNEHEALTTCTGYSLHTLTITEA